MADPAAAAPAADDPVAEAAALAGVDVSVARALIRENYALVDAEAPRLLQAVRDRGGAECWHKHSSFLSHLTNTYAISALWGLPKEVRLCALLHSAFSNSFVNLALFAPNEEGRAAVRELAGEEAERWTWLFCRVPRNELVYARLLDPIVYGGGGNDKNDDGEEDGRPAHAAKRPRGDGGCGPSTTTATAAPPPPPPPPPDYSLLFPRSVTVMDIRDASVGIELDAYETGTLLALTILDFSEQWHSWQDGMFATLDDGGGRLRFSGKRAHHLWPGPGKPGLYLHTLSEMGRLVVAANARLEADGDPRRVPLPRPWASCSYVVSPEAQLEGRDLYWRAATELFDAGAADFAAADEAVAESRAEAAKEAAAKATGSDCERDLALMAGREARKRAVAADDRGLARENEAERALRECARLLPCVGEPRVLLAQLLLQRASRMSWWSRRGDGGGKGDGAAASASTSASPSNPAADACWREARQLAIEGLSLLLAWGTPWDKRFPWGAWCAWARVCADAGAARSWPGNGEPLRVINLGLVR